MHKKNIIFFIFLLFIPMSFSFEIFSDDFESYSVNTSTWHNSDNGNPEGEWYCNIGITTTCKLNLASCSDSGYATIQQIEEELGNKFLHIAVDCLDSQNSYKYVQLNRNWTLMPASNDENLTIIYDIKLNDVDDTRLNNANEYRTAQIYISPASGMTWYNPLGFDWHSGNGIGGVNGTEEIFSRIRPTSYPFSTLENVPYDSDCDINDGQFHTITTHIFHNSTNFYRERIYIDDNPCMDYYNTGNVNLGSPGNQQIFSLWVYGVFDIYIDNIYFYANEIVFPEILEEEFIPLNCPIDGCLFYDDFSHYGNFGNISDGDWVFNPESAIIYNGKLFLNSSYDFPIIQHDLKNNNYDIVTGIVEFKSNISITPKTLNSTNPVTYAINTYCDTNNIVYSYNIYIFNDESFTSDNGTLIYNVYTLKDGKLRQLATLVTDNGETLIIKNAFDITNQKVSLDYVTAEDLQSGFVPSLEFTQDFFTPCSDISYTEIERRDNRDIDYFIGIDRIFYYGEDTIISNDNDDEIYQNVDKIEVNDSFIKSNLDENLHNVANTLGFRTTAGKLAFWLVIMFFFVIAIYQSPAPDAVKKYGGAFFLISFTVLGWYLKFIPTILFMFLIFIIAIVGALVYHKTFVGSSS